jgi:hypothetical protein
MKRSAQVAHALLTLATVVSPAAAGDASFLPVASPTRLWSSLPIAPLSRISRSHLAPDALESSESADGVWVIRPKWSVTSAEMPAATVVGSPELARDLKAGTVYARD